MATVCAANLGGIDKPCKQKTHYNMVEAIVRKVAEVVSAKFSGEWFLFSIVYLSS